MENTLKKINIMKKLIRNFIAASSFMLTKNPLLLKMLEDHRELLNVETILKMTQDKNDVERTQEEKKERDRKKERQKEM